MSRKFLITGGSGLLGQYLNVEAAKENDILTIYNNNVGNCSEFKSTKADITNFNMMKEIFSSSKPDVVIHTAAVTNPIPLPGQNPKDVYNVNVNAVTNVIVVDC